MKESTIVMAFLPVVTAKGEEPINGIISASHISFSEELGSTNVTF